MTIGELIKGSLRLIGAIASGETPSADEMKYSLSSLNEPFMSSPMVIL